jgi:RND family efflux transporter MFP subunit
MSREPSDSLKWRIGITFGLIVLVLAAAGGIFYVLVHLKKAPEKKASAPPRTVVRTEVANRQAWRETLSGYGRARALRRASVAAEISGVVKSISPDLDAGSEVGTGDVLVRIGQDEYASALQGADARRDQARAAADRLALDLQSAEEQLAIAREDLASSERELARIRGLAEKGVFTESELDRQKIATSLRKKEVIELSSREKTLAKEVERAEAEVQAAQAAWEKARIDLQRTEVFAPFPGTVEARRISRGDRVGPGTILFDLVDLSRVEVPVALGASRFGEVSVGAKATLRLREGGPGVWTGTVARISPVVDPADRTFLVYLEVTSETGHAPVPPGAFVVAEIEGPSHEGVIPVPRTAFVEDRLFVATPDSDGTALVSIRTPEVSRWLPSVALVSGGLSEGDRIVVTNIEQIADGSRVRLVADGEKSP